MKEVSEEQVKKEFEKRAEKVTEKDVEKAVNKSDEILTKVINSSVFKREVAKVRILISAIKDYKTGVYRDLPSTVLAAIVVALLYILSPIDLVPDAIPVIGLLDDLAMLTFVWRLVSETVMRYGEWKLDNGSDEGFKKLFEEAFGQER